MFWSFFYQYLLSLSEFWNKSSIIFFRYFYIGSIWQTHFSREQSEIRCSKWFQSISRPHLWGRAGHQIKFLLEGSRAFLELLQKWTIFWKKFWWKFFVFAHAPRVIECRSYKKMGHPLILTKLWYSKSDPKNINFSPSYGLGHFRKKNFDQIFYKFQIRHKCFKTVSNDVLSVIFSS